MTVIRSTSLGRSIFSTSVRRWRPQSGLPGWLSTQRRLLQSGEKILLVGRFPRNSTPKIGGLNAAPFLGAAQSPKIQSLKGDKRHGVRTKAGLR